MSEFPPGLILLLGALLVPVLPAFVRNAYVIALPALAFGYIYWLPETASFTAAGIQWLRVDKLSKVFGYIFTLNAFLVFIYAFHFKQRTEHTAALIYIGAALGTVFAGDLISAYIHWEIMAVASTVVILSRNTAKARGAALRYFLFHVFGGLLFLAGIVLVAADTGSFAFTVFDKHAGSPGMWLILLGFLVNAGAPPLHAWLSDAYPETSVSGGVILSAYTTKTAVYCLLRGFEGWNVLIWVGCAMSIYGIVYALLENDMRRILAYSIINQVGFMVAGAGMGGVAVSGVCAHAFCHIIYKSLLWMAAGAVLMQTGKSKCTELGGLYKTMPWTLLWGVIGALAISAVPFTSGFISKTIIIHEADHLKLFWPWLILEIASAGVFLHAGIKFPYFVFFNQDRGLRPREAPACMHLAMFFMAFLCVFLGIYSKPLYALLPHPVEYDPYTLPHIITQMQLLMFAGLVFFLFLPLLKRTDTVSLDVDWFWRKGARVFTWLTDKVFNGINAGVASSMGKVIPALGQLVESIPRKLPLFFAVPYWKARRLPMEELKPRLEARISTGLLPVGLTAVFVLFLLAILLSR